MNNEEFFRRHAGKYRLVKIVIAGYDASGRYEQGWKDKDFYMFFEITEDGDFTLKARAGLTEKEYRYYLDPVEMKYHLKADHSDEGTDITIENGVIREETDDHLMVYELTDELD